MGYVFKRRTLVVEYTLSDRSVADDFACRWQDCQGGMASRAARGQNDPDRVQAQDGFGKLAELSVFRLFKAIGVPGVVPPDLNVYPPGERDWSPDMRIGVIHVAVKACSLGHDRAEPSWVFQTRPPDRGIFVDIDPLSLVVFVAMYPDVADISAVVPVESLHRHNLFDRMNNPGLDSNKTAVYWDELVGAFVLTDGQTFTLDSLQAML